MQAANVHAWPLQQAPGEEQAASLDEGCSGQTCILHSRKATPAAGCSAACAASVLLSAFYCITLTSQLTPVRGDPLPSAALCHRTDLTCAPLPCLQELPCGHFMHSHCFGQYTKYNYTCPVCSKSMGDMSVYFRMIDSLTARIDDLPPEYASRRQVGCWSAGWARCSVCA